MAGSGWRVQEPYTGAFRNEPSNGGQEPEKDDEEGDKEGLGQNADCRRIRCPATGAVRCHPEKHFFTRCKNSIF